MTLNRFFDIPWMHLGNIGNNWELVSFKQNEIPSWENYLESQREYWGADESDQTRFKYYYGEDDTEKTFLRKTKEGYNNFIEYLLNWNGLCKINERVQVIEIQPNVIVLSKNWKGKQSDHSDLEIWLKEEFKYYFMHKRYCCEIYSFGTLFVPENSLEAKLGEQPGSQTISRRLGKEKDKNEKIIFREKENIIEISDAVFKIIEL